MNKTNFDSEKELVNNELRNVSGAIQQLQDALLDENAISCIVHTSGGSSEVNTREHMERTLQYYLSEKLLLEQCIYYLTHLEMSNRNLRKN